MIYQSDLFNPAEAESRTVHLGIDLNAPAGTPCFTPFHAEVLSVTNNSQALDYGPTIILKHWLPLDSSNSVEFYTLYGHLSMRSISKHHIEPGQYLQSGDLVGWM
jgi:murein DD-endopeptidase MepM/ murein hydrolase activator NlpD